MRISMAYWIASCFRRVLGCHPHPSCVGKVLGINVVLFKEGGCG